MFTVTCGLPVLTSVHEIEVGAVTLREAVAATSPKLSLYCVLVIETAFPLASVMEVAEG
jgi:hypothetical protein